MSTAQRRLELHSRRPKKIPFGRLQADLVPSFASCDLQRYLGLCCHDCRDARYLQSIRTDHRSSRCPAPSHAVPTWPGTRARTAQDVLDFLRMLGGKAKGKAQSTLLSLHLRVDDKTRPGRPRPSPSFPPAPLIVLTLSPCCASPQVPPTSSTLSSVDGGSTSEDILLPLDTSTSTPLSFPWPYLPTSPSHYPTYLPS